MSEFSKEIEDYFCKFTFGQFVTLILLELVTLFFVFYLGARYGPDLIGSRQTAKKQGLPTEAPKSVDEILGKAPVEYTYPEVLTDSGPPKKGGAIRVKPAGVTVEEYEKKRLIPVEKPEVLPKNEPTAAPKFPTGESKGSYAIQVGSYPTAEEANRMVDQWKKRGYTPFMSVGEIPNRGTWYRVRIGDFETRDAATRYLEDFKQKERISALVVQSQS